MLRLMKPLVYTARCHSWDIYVNRTVTLYIVYIDIRSVWITVL